MNPVTIVPESAQPRVLGAKRGASKAVVDLARDREAVEAPRRQEEARVVALRAVRVLGVSMSPSAAETMPSPLVSTSATAAL